MGYVFIIRLACLFFCKVWETQANQVRTCDMFHPELVSSV